MHTIKHIHAREVIDSQGNPTVEAEVTLETNHIGWSAIPSGASRGIHEAHELRDKDVHRFDGKGVSKAIENIQKKIAPEILGRSFDQSSLDDLLQKIDGSDTKEHLGANAILAISLAFAWAVSEAEEIWMYEYIGQLFSNKNYLMPRPMFNIMNGGRLANWATDIQEYMVIPISTKNWAESLRTGSEIYHTLEKLLMDKGYSTNVGHEGGFAPEVSSNEEAQHLIVQMVEQAGYKLEDDIMFGFDAASSQFYNNSTQTYTLKRDGAIFSRNQMVDWIVGFSKRYPVKFFEDMLAEDDWQGWQMLMEKIDTGVGIVGDDLLVTSVKRIEEAIQKKACNSLIVKMNQIGTLTETLNAMKKAQEAGWTSIVSHRSAETEDVTIAHLAVGTGCGWIKCGAPARGERTAKYNELTRIAEKVES